MIRRVKSREKLLELFKEDIDYTHIDGNWQHKSSIWFNKNMFRYCGEELEFRVLDGNFYDYYGKKYCWMEDWLESAYEDIPMEKL